MAWYSVSAYAGNNLNFLLSRGDQDRISWTESSAGFYNPVTLISLFSRQEVVGPTMKSLALAFGSVVFLMFASYSAYATPARFWLSLSASDPGDPQGPKTTRLFVGSNPSIHIWAQPGRDDATGMFKVLENVSLNLVLSKDSTNSSAIKFVDESITVYNDPLPSGIPAMPTQQRFEFVHDTSSGLAANQECEDGTIAQGICGLQGLTVNIDDAGLFTGVGGDACDPNDPHCAGLPGGDPAWLIASTKIQPLVDGATANFRLQIGANGINHRGESSAKTQVYLGGDNTPIYQAGSDRNTNLVGGQFDAPHLAAQIIQPDPDFNGDGIVDNSDLRQWEDSFGMGTGGDADFDGDSDGIDFLFWQRFYHGPPMLEGQTVPEPASGALLTFVLLLRATPKRRRFD